MRLPHPGSMLQCHVLRVLCPVDIVWGFLVDTDVEILTWIVSFLIRMEVHWLRIGVVGGCFADGYADVVSSVILRGWSLLPNVKNSGNRFLTLFQDL